MEGTLPLAGESFARPPKPGERLMCLSRSFLYTLITPNKENGFKPQVRSILIRKPGERSVVCGEVDLVSLVAWIQAHESTPPTSTSVP